jgi:outer membrane biogenesis lipoprotein LolB
MIKLQRILAYTILILISFTLLVGCAGTGPKLEKLYPTPESVKKSISSNYNKLERFEAELSISMRALIIKGSFFGHCQIEHPRKIHASMSGPMGFGTGIITISDDIYEMEMSNGSFESGNVDSFDLEKMTGLPIPVDNLFVLFEPVSAPPAEDDITQEFYIREGDSLWVWNLDDGDFDRQIIFDPEDQVVIEEDWSVAGQSIINKKYQKYVTIKGINLAGKVEIKAKGKLPVTLNISYNDARINPTWKKDPFRFKTVKTQ